MSLLEMLKNGFVDGSDAVVDESLTKQHRQHAYPHVVVVVALATEHYYSLSRLGLYVYR